MNGNKLLEIISDIDPRLIEDAEKTPRSNRRLLVGVTSIAGTAVAAALVAVSIGHITTSKPPVIESNSSENTTSHENSMENSSVINDNSSENSSVPDDSSSDSTSNEPKKDYSIISKDGENFIVFDNIEKYQNNNAQVSATVDFPSMKAFKDAVTKGTLTDWQKSTIANNFKKDEDGKIFSCDFNNLFVPQIPKDSKIEKVLWYGGNIYSFEFTSSEDVFGFVSYLSESLFNEIYQREYQSLYDRSISKIEKIDDNKEAIYYSTSMGNFMNIRYTLSGEGKTFVVDESYCLSINHTLINPSAEVPQRIELYCCEGEQRYRIIIHDLVEKPTDDWLLSFGIEKFVDSE